MERVAALRAAILEDKGAHAIVRKQKDNGLWGGNLLGFGASKAYGWKEVGTVFQYRRLLELGWPADQRPLRQADRFLFRLLSRDDDPVLLVEFQRPAKTDPGLGVWGRNMGREAAAAALARAGHVEDPRLRGAAHKVASDISLYLRSELVEKPFRKQSGKTILDPRATPPTMFGIEMLAFMPAVQRERAGFIDRLASYFGNPAPKRAFFVLAGRKFLKPTFELLGDPLRSDAQGHVPDVPFAVYWLELLAPSAWSGRSKAPAGCSRGCSASATSAVFGAPRTCVGCQNLSVPSWCTGSRSKDRGRVRRNVRPTSRFGLRSSLGSWDSQSRSIDSPGLSPAP